MIAWLQSSENKELLQNSYRVINAIAPFYASKMAIADFHKYFYSFET
jgi:hypothetical protein